MKGFNKKGQSSIEMLLVTVAIITMVVLVFGKFFQVSDSTSAMILLKNHALGELQKADGFYFIEEIEEPEVEGRTINLRIKIGGGSLSQNIKNQIESSASEAIASSTKFETVNIIFA